MRTLATIQNIINLQSICNADQIEVASVMGWHVVVKKGDYQIGDKIIYLEIDSWVPNAIAPFLSKNEPKEFEGIKGERLKTIKLRGQISQGLVLPLNTLKHESINTNIAFENLCIGEDVTDLLGIKKWEAPIPANLSGLIKGSWPGFLQKTDEERIQSMPELLLLVNDINFIAHEKLDGSSMTVYYNEGDFCVCSRNLNLKETEGNAFWQVANNYSLREKMTQFGENIAIQGELVGPSVQGNKYNLQKLDFYVFNVFDINTGKYLDTHCAKEIVTGIQFGLKWVPFVTKIQINDYTTVEYLLHLAEGPSLLNPNQEREGLVWRPLNEIEFLRYGRVSFKTISNKFLLKGGD